MSEPRRTTVYLDPELHRTLRLRAAESDVSISEMVNDAVRLALAEDASDLEALAARKRSRSSTSRRSCAISSGVAGYSIEVQRSASYDRHGGSPCVESCCSFR